MPLLETVWQSIQSITLTVNIWINCAIYKYSKRNSQRNEEDINGKCVVITGGSNGIGRASATEFARRGAIVVFGDVDLENGRKAEEEIRRDTGNTNVTFIKLDLSDMESVEQFAQKVSADHPKIKILMNNAGIGVSEDENIKTKDGLNLHVAVNFMGHFLLTNLLMDNLKAETNSRIVSTCSTLLLMHNFNMNDINMDKITFGFQNCMPYCNTKFMLALFTKYLETENGIKSYALCPGSLNTNIVKKIPLFMNVDIPRLFVTTPDEAASEFIMFCALEKSIENESGKMYRFRKQFDRVNKRLDMECDLAKKLCERSATLVRLNERLSRIKNNNIPK